ncbi:hypothetical protein [Cereibacter sphaeroides]|uniref:hypothetical protein n=1 Tax=Cereibacter sphaeroides TaxID=1063 RepID=UPI001F15D515|nr:hypothetical protein [Cereibacter sphaeroides]MCE6970709.1 hypothetical protein [Cereibacter sphaeroides]
MTGPGAMPLCLGLAAATDALRAAIARGDAEAMLEHEADLRRLAESLAQPGTRGVSRGQVLLALVAARDAVREAQEALEAARTRQAAEGMRKRRLQLAYGEGARP